MALSCAASRHRESGELWLTVAVSFHSCRKLIDVLVCVGRDHLHPIYFQCIALFLRWSGEIAMQHLAEAVPPPSEHQDIMVNHKYRPHFGSSPTTGNAARRVASFDAM